MHAAIIGLGLMGGSLALALRRAGWASPITAVARRPETLAAARAAGAIDRGATDLASARLDEADVIVLAFGESDAQIDNKPLAVVRWSNAIEVGIHAHLAEAAQGREHEFGALALAFAVFRHPPVSPRRCYPPAS